MKKNHCHYFLKIFPSWKTFRNSVYTLIIGTILVFSACHKEPNIQIKVNLRDYCPKCSDEISWNNYGIWELGTGKIGEDGTLGSEIPTNLMSSCDWETYRDNILIQNRSTYQVQSEKCGAGVIFEWKINQFDAFYLSEGWTGTTREGIELGDDLNLFLKTYPEFEMSSTDTLEYDYESKDVRSVKAVFNRDKKLTNLFIKRF